MKLEDWSGPLPRRIDQPPAGTDSGAVSMTTIMAKEPVIEKRLAPKGAGGGFSVLIPPGMRAVPLAGQRSGRRGGVRGGGHARRRADLG